MFSSHGFVNRLPKRILLIRHGESLGNFDESAYTHTPDWTIPLTPEGINQSRELGKKLRGIVGKGLGSDPQPFLTGFLSIGPLFVYCSPYVRTKQTLKYVMESFTDSEIVGVREEPRISGLFTSFISLLIDSEQQFGNFQNGEAMLNAKCERSTFGRFYYRFPEGEAGLDVYNRVTSFIATLFRLGLSPSHPDLAQRLGEIES
jgi:broad specificity phosphatase PhoE